MSMGYIKMFYDWMDKADELTDEELGSLMRALVIYARDGKSVTPIGAAKILFPVFRIYVDGEAKAYEEMCEKRREAGIKSGISRRKIKHEQVLKEMPSDEQVLFGTNKMNQEKENEKEEEKENEKDIFIYNQAKEPDIDEINKYITENNLNIDGEEFYDHYSAVGWKIGGNPIVDYKAALRRWARGAKNRKTDKPKPKDDSGFDIDDFFQAALERKYEG